MTTNELVVFFGVMFISVDNTFMRPKVNRKKVIERLNLGGKGAILGGFPGSDSRGLLFCDISDPNEQLKTKKLFV